MSHAGKRNAAGGGSAYKGTLQQCDIHATFREHQLVRYSEDNQLNARYQFNTFALLSATDSQQATTEGTTWLRGKLYKRVPL